MFIRKKAVNGREYYYAVQSTRKDGRVVKIERYVGLAKPTEKDLVDLRHQFDTTALYLRSQKEALEDVRTRYLSFVKSATKDQLNKYEEQVLVSFTYDSSRIEGSKLTLKDTKDLLLDGISPSHKPSRDIRETENHSAAYAYIKNHRGKIDRKTILDLHRILKDGVTEDAGRFRDGGVSVGNLVPVKAAMIDAEIHKLLGWLHKNTRLHPIELTTVFHCDFERIHPFFDGNGRVGRLLMNLILLKSGYPIVIIRNIDRRRYYNALRRADDGNYLYMMKYVVQCLKRANH